MQRTLGLFILVVSMLMFALGADAVPTAKQWIVDDYGYKTIAFLICGIISMVAGATVACFAKTNRRGAALKK